MGKRADALIFVVSLIISVSLWLWVQILNDPTKEREIQVSLDTRNLNEGLVVTSMPDKVWLVAEGTKASLEALDTESLVAMADLGNARVGTHDYDVLPESPRKLPVTLRLRRPRERITVEPLKKTEREVELQFSGAPPPGYEVAQGSVIPERVTVSAPESEIVNIKRVRALLDLGVVRPGGSYSVKLEVLNDDGVPVPLAATTPASVNVSPAVAPTETFKRAVVVPDWVGEPKFGYRVVDYKINPAQVEVTGPSGTLANLSTLETERLSIKDLDHSKTFKVKLRVPEGVRLLKRKQIVVNVQVEPMVTGVAKPK